MGWRDAERQEDAEERGRQHGSTGRSGAGLEERERKAIHSPASVFLNSQVECRGVLCTGAAVTQPGCSGAGRRLLTVHYLFSLKYPALAGTGKPFRAHWETKEKTVLALVGGRI